MFTPPNAKYQGGAVPQNLWPFFSTRDQATTLLPALQAISGDVQLMDGLGMDLFIPVEYLDEITKIWVFKGTVPNPGGANLGIDEFVGSLWDRQFKPNPFVDGVGGKKLVAVPVAADLAQLKWGAGA